MYVKSNTILFLMFLSALVHGQEELRDNYLPITFTIKDNELVGESEYLD